MGSGETLCCQEYFSAIAETEFRRVCAYAPGIVDTPMWDKIDLALGKEVSRRCS